MLRSLIGSLVLLAACTTAPSGPVTVDPDEAGSGDGKADSATQLPDVRCAAMPDAGPSTSWRHFKSNLIAIGDGHHRGIDLVANDTAEAQVIRGEASYQIIDKALEDEDVDVFACRHSQWVKLGTARTDDEGGFALSLTGDARLPVGMRDMALSVRGDRTAAKFLAVVATEDSPLAVSDVDGTLTTSENAFVENVFGISPDIHDGAAAGWQHVASTGRIPVYVTARARLFTSDTRDWLASKGLPRGPVRLAPHILLPGSSTVDYKASTLADLGAQLPLDIGVGNRSSDIDAYTQADISPDHIFIKLPDFSDEVAAQLQAGDAIGFDTYPGPLAHL